MRKHWKALVAVAAVVIAVVVAAIIISARPDATAEPTPDSDNTITTGTLGFPVSDINIGEGGTATAPDGRTPIGYDGSCDSAAQAAAAYTPLLSDINIGTWPKQKETLLSVAIDGPWVEDATATTDAVVDVAQENELPGLFDGGWMSQTDVAAGGMYRMVSCESEGAALIQVLYGGLNAGDTLPEGFFGTQSMELTWDGDWKISDALLRTDPELEQRLPDQGPSGGYTDEGTGVMPVLTSDVADYYFDDLSREGWIEYANAKR